MQHLCVLSILLFSAISWGQNHENNLQSILTLEAAEEYAARFDEVFMQNVNVEKDFFFFQSIDTSDMKSYVGTFQPSFRTTSKILQDSTFNIVNIQVIRINLKKISPETAEILMGQIKKLLERGDSFWDIKKRFSHTSVEFTSAPEIMEEVAETYDIASNEMIANATFNFETPGKSVGIVIIEKDPHPVPGFCNIMFINPTNVGTN